MFKVKVDAMSALLALRISCMLYKSTKMVLYNANTSIQNEDLQLNCSVSGIHLQSLNMYTQFHQ